MSLARFYYNDESPGYLGSVKKLFDASRAGALRSKPTHKQVKKWLSAQEVYTLHKPVRKRILRNYYTTFEINGLWQADIIDLHLLKKFNDGHGYILAVIDVFSKFVYAQPLKTKSAAEVTKAFRNMIDGAVVKEGVRSAPRTLQTDEGKEFINKDFKAFLKSRNIRLHVRLTMSLHKQSIIERFNRTMQTLIRRYFTATRAATPRYVDVLSKLVHLYNNTVHSTTKMKPSAVTIRHVKFVYENTHRRHRNRIPMNIYTQPFQLGDKVRIRRAKSRFEAGYTINWSREIFVVSNIIRKKPLYLYQLKDSQQSQIRKKFYGSELQRVNI